MARQTTLFDKVVEQAMQNTPDSHALQVVVEKELLHHDILREMSNVGFLKQLTFIGGTCLRAVYGSKRLSEDLDFTGGVNFNSQSMGELTNIIKQSLYRKYELDIDVSEPRNTGGNVDTWKVKVVTRPCEKHMPMQQINIGICAVPSHDIRYDTLKNHYGINMGTNGLLVPVQSLEEIFADKIVAMAFRPNRLKHRDLWDIAYLVDKQIECPSSLVELKIADHKQTKAELVNALSSRLETLPALSKSFDKEMRRFVPSEVASLTLDNENYWSYLVDAVTRVSQRQIDHINKIG